MPLNTGEILPAINQIEAYCSGQPTEMEWDDIQDELHILEAEFRPSHDEQMAGQIAHETKRESALKIIRALKRSLIEGDHRAGLAACTSFGKS